MSERPEYMPSDEEIRDAIDAAELLTPTQVEWYRYWNKEWSVPLRALIAAAVEKALAEQRHLVLEEAARAVCCECGALGMPDIYDDGDWKHDINGHPSLCDAQDIHDLISGLTPEAK